MEKLCPLCNKLIDGNVKCVECGKLMNDLGRVQEFRDSYGNGEEVEVIDNGCLHYFKCKNCNCEKNIYFKDVII